MTENRARDVVLDRVWKMRLVDNRKHVVAASNAVRDQARILEHEDMVLRIRNDSSLVLRYLHHGQTLEVHDGVRHCRSRVESITSLSVELAGNVRLHHSHPRVPLYVRAHQFRYGKPGYLPGFVSSFGMPP